ncbi:hypothetical protein HBI56_180330 [Parastagonospora nodorum]|uniref:Uncharacterized protein n=1 Tax=Phaeosphaeria nodorum (strain SN15 / ATCC MYA-4574 / FGSC 10173) TaxID=321614 RepID=A0A7U2FB98_PHANO|nr:hypothetical protein HBH56_185760 [Parastagonospora nodorum]QRD01074.1 hypothetical protein JI435_153240 [Parastagonospora nodorum SN15]KAH3925245.1 hypothetical protein HBH54_182800 [Parastagonospora nodorum]KAH3940615.1 hypothetical protein HBH53_214370 [Parastagonospora nodorum]KAH3958205.1 hypothetical protein HBH51_212020 [Parastagonospora nodorum]
MQIYSVLALFLGTAMSAAVERDVSPGNVLMERQALDCAVGLTGSAFCGACRDCRAFCGRRAARSEDTISPANVLMERQALDCAVGLTGGAFCGACRDCGAFCGN